MKFEWNSKCQKPFDKLKSILCSEPIFKHPDYTKPFIQTTDASNKTLEAIRIITSGKQVKVRL